MLRYSTHLLRIALLGLLFLGPLDAQTQDAKKTKCTPPRPTRREHEPAYRHCGKYDCVAVLDVLVDSDGNVSSASVLTSSGNEKYDRDALSAMKGWKFAPSICDGQASPAHIKINMEVHAN